MFKLYPKKFGIQLVPQESLTEKDWFKLSVHFRELKLDPLSQWSLSVDMRNLPRDPEENDRICEELGKLALRHKARRILFLFESKEEARRQRREGRNSPNGSRARFLHTGSNDSWQQKADNWLLRGEDPDVISAQEYEDLLLK